MFNSKIGKFNFLVFLLLIFTYFPAESMAASKIKIGIVNLDRAGRESKRGKEILGPLKSEVKRQEEKINRKQERVKTLEKELKKQGLIMSEEVKMKKEADFRFERKSLERYIRDAQEEIEIKRRRAINKIFAELLGVIKEIGKKEDYTYIIPNEAVIYHKKAVDITNKVIREYNKKFRKKKSSR